MTVYPVPSHNPQVVQSKSRLLGPLGEPTIIPDDLGLIKYWNGSSWVRYPIKFGAGWPEINLKLWRSGAWVPTSGAGAPAAPTYLTTPGTLPLPSSGDSDAYSLGIAFELMTGQSATLTHARFYFPVAHTLSGRTVRVYGALGDLPDPEEAGTLLSQQSVAETVSAAYLEVELEEPVVLDETWLYMLTIDVGNGVQAGYSFTSGASSYDDGVINAVLYMYHAGHNTYSRSPSSGKYDFSPGYVLT